MSMMPSSFAIFILTTLLITDAAHGAVIIEKSMAKQCDSSNPCPLGSYCLQDPIYAGVKACHQNMGTGQRRPGRCPTVGAPLTTGSAFSLQQCFGSSSCPANQRCCVSQGRRMCMQSQAIPVTPTITVLVDGSLQPQGGTPPSGFDFKATLTLVQSSGKNIIVDTGAINQKMALIIALREQGGLELEDVDFVVTTHGHPDHFSNGNIFPDVRNNFGTFTVVGSQFTLNALARSQQFFIDNDPNVEIIATPGHTPQCTSLIVRNVPGRGTVAVVGDLFYFEQDYLQPQLRANSPDKDRWEQSRARVACLADYIVPGHGPMFQVSAAIKQAFACTSG